MFLGFLVFTLLYNISYKFSIALIIILGFGLATAECLHCCPLTICTDLEE